MTIKKLISICIIIMAAGAAWNACSGAMQPEPQAMIGTGYSTLRSTGGAALYEQAWAGTPVTATLAATGDHLLEIRSSGQFTVGVEIR